MIRFWLILLASCLSASISISSGLEDNDDGNATSTAVVLSSYHVSANVNSRLMTTSIDMVFENSEDCASIYATTLQLPRGARVTDLVMDLSDGCQLESQVKDLGAAMEDFEEFYSEGKAAAILTAWDMSNYELQVSIPPTGTTHVLLQYQELLFQKLDRVSFQVPMFPGIRVDDLKVDISVENSVTGILDFQTDLQDEAIETETIRGIKNASMHYETRGVTEDTFLPTLFQAFFRPGPTPEDGLFFSDGECFTHVFNPTKFLFNAGSMARKIVFVIDVSGSMAGQKLEDAKASFSVMIDTLEERDILILQSFSDKGTEGLWGPKAATRENKEIAKNFVMQLETIGSTNLNDAFLDGIDRVSDAPETVAPILVMMTDGQGNSDRTNVAKNVRNKNEDGKVKIFSLAFGNNADINLLLGIAIQNGGRAVRIYEGFGDAANQMEVFYKQELGSILMSDVGVSYDFGEVGVLDSTVTRFPVLAAGSEIVVRGRIDPSTALNATSRTLKSVVSANSAAGPMEWPIDNVVVIPETKSNSDCHQSFAQARIVELLEYRDASQAIGEVFFGTTPGVSGNLAALSFEEQARKIALDAHLVWPGLTALVTIENTNCQQNNSDVCYSGASRDGSSNDYADADAYTNGYASAAVAKSDTKRSWFNCFDASSLALIVWSSMALVF